MRVFRFREKTFWSMTIFVGATLGSQLAVQAGDVLVLNKWWDHSALTTSQI